MKKEIKILNIKVPVVAILITLMVIGTASAAVYQHYATLQGNVTINSPISVTVDGHEIPLGGTHTLVIEDIKPPCTISETFYFNNTYGSELDVSILWILYEYGAPEPLDASTSYWVYDNEIVTVPDGTSSFEASLDVPVYMMGDHVFRIDVNPVY